MIRNKTKLLFIATFLFLAIPLMLTGTASAKYMQDGSVPNPAGGFIAPTDGICVLSIDINGNMVVDATVLTKRDCDARLVAVTAVTSNDLLANVCVKPASNTSALRYAAPGSSTCVTVDGSQNINGSISMKNLDRDTQMCVGKGGQLANVGNAIVKNTANGTAAQCLAYGWQYRGQTAAGVPLAFTGLGTTQGAGTGYCYTTMNMTTAYATAALCPATSTNQATSYDWSWSSSKCTYAKGIAGYANSALLKLDGTTATAANTFVDLSTKTTLGACLAAGGSWANWIGQAASTTAVATTPTASTIPAWNYTMNTPDSDNGCLHCHSTKVQQNGPEARQKDSYLQTGHKNMLRKVINGNKQTDTNNVVYTTDGTNAITFNNPTYGGTGTINVLGVDRQLYYVYGDWMAPLPSVVYGTTAVGVIGATNNYTCYACHSTGASDNTLTCTVNPSQNITAALCTAASGTFTAAAIPGVESIGTPGYAGIEPGASFPGINLGATSPNWDLEGINCSRCHNATQVGPRSAAVVTGGCSVTSGGPFLTQATCNTAGGQWFATASNFPTTAPTSGGMGALASGTGRTNLCFGCHQSIDKIWPAGTTPTIDPTVIPTGISHGAASGRDFNGHVLGNSFLNSVHAKFTGTITINSLGKYDLSDPNGTVEYSSIFKGYACYQSVGSANTATTMANGNPIKTQTDCDTLYACSKPGNATQAACTTAGGTWATTWAAEQAPASQGTCSTCHDVHNSLFVTSQETVALKKTCTDCHVNNLTNVSGGNPTAATDAAAPQVVVANINHPTGTNTPFDVTKYNDACAVCHMALQAEANGDQNSMPVHVWRINTNSSYNTFPTAGQFYGGTCSVHSGAIANAPSLPVVYTSDTSSVNCGTAGGSWTAVAKTRSAQTSPDGAYTNAVWVDLDLACGQCHGGNLKTSAYASNAPAPYMTKANLSQYAQAMHGAAVTTYPIDPAMDPTRHTHVSPVASTSVAPVSSVNLGISTTMTDNSTWDGQAFNTTDSPTLVTAVIYINWGDGSGKDIANAGTSHVFSHTYVNTGSYTIVQTIEDSLGYSNTKSYPVTVVSPGAAVATGTFAVTTSPAMQNVNIIMTNGHYQFTGVTSAAGTVTLPAVANSMPAGVYVMNVYAPYNAITLTTPICYTDALHTLLANGTSQTVTGSLTLYCQ